MKVLITSDTYLPLTGGAEIHVSNLIKNLKAKGHQVFLLTNTLGDSSEIYSKDILRIPWQRNYFTILKAIFKATKSIDIIHSHYCYRLAFFAGLMAKFRRKPFFVTLHGLGILNHPGTVWYYQAMHSLYRYVSLKLADKVISTSQDLAGFAYKYISPKKVIIISNGVDFRLFSQERDSEEIENLRKKYQDKKIILSVRRLNPKNGIQYLIETMPYILSQDKNIKYLIIGQGRLEKQIRKRITELNLNNYVEMLGEIPNEKIYQYMTIANVVVFPSTAESTSIACLEAMACAKPIVASKVGGLIELLGENNERGILIKLFDWGKSSYDAPPIDQVSKEKYQLLARVILKVLEDEKLAQEISSKAQKYVKENHDWEIITDKIIDVYKLGIYKKKTFSRP